MSANGNFIYQKESILKIDKSAIAHNIKTIQGITSGQIIAVIKENGYGLGFFTEYQILKELGMNYFAVTNVAEALSLREFGCTDPVLLMSPILTLSECVRLVEADITMMAGSTTQLELLRIAAVECSCSPKIHIKIDTGMGRYGFMWNDIPDNMKELTEGLTITGCYSHLAGKPKGYAAQAHAQADRLRKAINVLQAQGIDTGLCHLSNSAGTCVFGDLGFDGVRVGSAIIGKSAGGAHNLQTAVWLEARIYDKFYRKKGDTIGYQSTAVLKRDSTLGLVRIGHGDGIYLGYADTPETFWHSVIHAAAVLLMPKRYKNFVSIQGKQVPIVGRLGVAHMVIDLTDFDFTIGDTVKISVNPLFIHPSVEKEVIKES